MLSAVSSRSALLRAHANPQAIATAMVPVRNHSIGCSLDGFIVLIGWDSSPIRRLRPRKNDCRPSEERIPMLLETERRVYAAATEARHSSEEIFGNLPLQPPKQAEACVPTHNLGM